MKTLVIATNNPGKLVEFQALLGDFPAQLLTPPDLGLALEVEETGLTYAENARLKAIACAQLTGHISVGDDSGLEVEALGGAPGVYSARYAGPGASDADRRAKLLHELRAVPAPRRARFRCALAVAEPAGAVTVFEGVCEGEIAFIERGTNGFGYDPLFLVAERGQMMAELPDAEKNQISHRGRAVQAAWPFLINWATAANQSRR